MPYNSLACSTWSTLFSTQNKKQDDQGQHLFDEESHQWLDKVIEELDIDFKILKLHRTEDYLLKKNNFTWRHW